MIGILFTIFSPVGRILKALWAWATKDPMRLVIIALLALSAFLALSNASLRGDVRHKDKVIALRDATIKDMDRASKEARAAQIALNKQVTDKQTEIARLSDDVQNRNKLIARANDYAGRMSAKGYCRKASAAAESGIAESGNGPSADAVILERADFDILNANTARLADVFAWGERLKAEGLAVNVE
jgi:TolA-binding protein